jgi:hypothetical protein
MEVRGGLAFGFNLNGLIQNKTHTISNKVSHVVTH